MKKKRKIKLILCLLLILLLILIIILIKLKNNEDDDSYDRGPTVYINSSTQKIYPENIYSIIVQYKGSNDISKVYSFLYNYNELVESLFKRKDTISEDLDGYFNDNKEVIIKYSGIDNSTEFKSFFDNVISKFSDEFIYDKSIIDIETIKNDDEKLSCKMTIKYSNKFEYDCNLNIKMEDDENPFSISF